MIRSIKSLGRPGPDRLHIPEEVFGHRILAVLGHGAGVVVYAAIEPDSGRICAIKHVVVRNRQDERVVERLRREYTLGQTARRTVALYVRKSGLARTTQAALVVDFAEEFLESACERV